MKINSNFSLKFTRYTFAVILPIFFFTSCFSVKTSTTKSGKKLYETYYVGESETQYFIKPLEFDGENKNDKMNLDFTFRYKNELKDSAVINISIVSDEIVRTAKSILFTGNNTSIIVVNPKLMFNEKNNEKFLSRFTAKISMKDLNELILNGIISVEIKCDAVKLFKTNKLTEKKIISLKENVFILFKD